ncbi:MAG: hypothetical protein AAGC68_04745 [Verrucomicrobiota bacterium]
MRVARSPREAAFSLFEIVVALAIFGLIAGTVLSVLIQAGDTAAELRYLDRRDDEVNRFIQLLRETIEGLPPEASLSMTPASESTSGYDELLLENTATAFVFGETVGSAAEVYIGLIPSESQETGEPLFDLALSRDDFEPEDDGSGMAFNVSAGDLLHVDEEGRYWLPLLSGVSGAIWRYWDEEQEEWLDEWTDDEQLPPVLEFSLVETAAGIPRTTVIRVPDRLSDSDAQEAADSATSTSVTTTSVTTDSSGSGDSSSSSTQSNDGGTSSDAGGDR